MDVTLKLPTSYFYTGWYAPFMDCDVTLLPRFAGKAGQPPGNGGSLGSAQASVAATALFRQRIMPSLRTDPKIPKP
eukprot:s1968_g17.t1